MSTQFTTIQSYNTAFGGVSYRATSNGEQVNIQILTQSSDTWRTERTMSAADFDAYADKVGMEDPYNQNPAHLAHLCNEQDEELQWVA